MLGGADPENVRHAGDARPQEGVDKEHEKVDGKRADDLGGAAGQQCHAAGEQQLAEALHRLEPEHLRLVRRHHESGGQQRLLLHVLREL
eukprot:1872504-Pyramimonas_sp.AAC.2